VAGIAAHCSSGPAWAGAAFAPLGTAAPIGALNPLVQLIDTDEHEDHADVTVQFACSVRYIANSPFNRGSSTTIRLRLGPDCGNSQSTITPELPLVGGGGRLVTGASLDSVMPGEVRLELSFARELDFVLAPTASGLGLRLRLLGLNKRKGGALLSDVEAPTDYAVNLESSTSPIERAAVEAAAAELQTQAYVSETDIEEEHWYRLRVGPFATRAEAERVLGAAVQHHPQAWLADEDVQTALEPVDRAGIATPMTAGPVDPPLPDAERAQLLRGARAALENHEYPRSIDLLGRLLRQPEYPARAAAQELIGLARERSGQLAQAKAEFTAYLRRYPDGEAAARVRSRLATLAAAGAPPRSTGEFGAARPESSLVAGAAALTYQYGKDQTLSAGTSTSTTAVDAALVYGDLLLRNHGARYDVTARLDGGYTENIVKTSGGSQDRTTAAYLEVTDRPVGLTGRIGRQSLASQGVIGLFDGLLVGYQVNPSLALSAAAGLPAYTSYSPVSSQQKFATVTAEFGPYREAWIVDSYFYDQVEAGFTDRRAVGMQARYTRAGRTAIMLADYDIAFAQLNSVTLIGNWGPIASWVFGVDADYRRSPQLLLSNALIGQSATTLTALENEVLHATIKQLALDRTATSETFVLSASRPLGERWQLMTDFAAIELGGTPASGGVPATAATGLDKSASVQLSASSLLQASDLHIFGLRYDDSPAARSTTLSWDARFALPGAWRFGPRFSVERLDDPGLGGRQTIYLPQLRGDWTGRRAVFELIGGYQLQQQQLTAPGSSLDQRSLYVSATYRWRF